MPPLEHVAFAELLARVQHDLRSGQPRLEKRERQHVLQLVAIAGRAAKLVRADAAEQPRGVELIGQPGVDQPVEVRPVGADLDLAEPLGPGGARRRKFGLGALRRRRAPRPRALPRGSAPGRRRSRSSSRRPAAERSRRRRPPRAARRRARRRRSRPVSTIAGVRILRPGPPKKRARMVSVVGRSRLVAAKAKPRTKSLLRILEQQRRADRLVVNLVDARIGAVLEREIEERRDRAGASDSPRDCAGSEDACRPDSRAERRRHIPSRDRRATS